jgi:hypothetical protein
MKKTKSPWYGVLWIVVWTAALAWFLISGMFDQRESIGLIIIWFVFTGTTVYLLIQNRRLQAARKAAAPAEPPKPPALNAPCPCGSGMKYKRCCGADSR